ncbi:hypothetical protein M9H77_04881 [Catharanthus roseus]|uniref:Uncharacterized protein n=1 Tax=Catharanthus roseus TaxID=4058 RepID=A0ACC0CFW0_CATRO|nr:hypothetical protein M9H77_04881 [Catharanthus roseus]
MYEVRADRYRTEWLTTTQYTNLCDVWSPYAFKKKRETTRVTICRGVVARGPASTPAGLGHSLSGRIERLHIETGSPMPTDKPLMFKNLNSTPTLLPPFPSTNDKTSQPPTAPPSSSSPPLPM